MVESTSAATMFPLTRFLMSFSSRPSCSSGRARSSGGSSVTTSQVMMLLSKLTQRPSTMSAGTPHHSAVSVP